MDTCGNWICGFSVLLGTCITIEEEIWALVHGLRMAWGKGIRRLVVETDSMLVHAWVTNKNPKHRRHATLLKESADFLSRDWNVQVHHIHRGGIKRPTILQISQWAVKMERFLSSILPHGFGNLLKQDTMGSH